MVGCVLSQLKPSVIYILSCGNGFGLSASAFSTAKNVVFLGLYPIHKIYSCVLVVYEL